MSRLIDIDAQVQLESEPEGYKLRYYTFDTLSALEVTNIETTSNTSVCVNYNDSSNNNLLELPINNDILSQLQQKDMFCNNIFNTNREGKYYRRTCICNERQTVKKIRIDGDNTYETTILPRALIA